MTAFMIRRGFQGGNDIEHDARSLEQSARSVSDPETDV